MAFNPNPLIDLATRAATEAAEESGAEKVVVVMSRGPSTIIGAYLPEGSSAADIASVLREALEEMESGRAINTAITDVSPS